MKLDKFNGQTLYGYNGDTLASALLANNIHLIGRSFKYHRPRGIMTCGSEFIGLRVPDNPITLSLISNCGGYLVGTSANISGTKSNHSASLVISQLPNLDAILIDDIENKSIESTIVKVEDDAINIIRSGSIDSKLIQNIS